MHALLPVVRTPALAALVLCASTLSAQHHHEHGTSTAPAQLSSRAQEQVRTVQAAVTHLSTPEAARAAGFRPVLGWIPSMGTHWVNHERMRDGFDITQPDHLMFSPVDGAPRLVGVAYAFRGAPNAAMPDGFDGTLDQWHDHPFLAPGSATLHMLHVWFVPSPDGAFAGHNPWLPYYAAGLEPPDAGRLRDSVSARRIRELSAALAVASEPMPLARVLSRRASAATTADVQSRRGAIRQLIPELRKAQSGGDTAAWDRLADTAGRHWRSIRTAYIGVARRQQGKELVARLLDQTMGGEGSGHH